MISFKIKLDMELDSFLKEKMEAEKTVTTFKEMRSNYAVNKDGVLKSLQKIEVRREGLKSCLLCTLGLELAGKHGSEKGFAQKILVEAEKIICSLRYDTLDESAFSSLHDSFFFYSQIYISHKFAAQAGIRSLLQMTRILSRNPLELTPAHPQILKLIIHSKMYTLGDKLFQQKFEVFNGRETGLEPIDVCCFFYYRGYIRTTLKKYSEAYDDFRLALVQPCTIAHLCLINAYKKYILVGLLSGKPCEFPTAGSSFLKAFLPRYVSKYTDLIIAMHSQSQKALEEKITKHKEIFIEDKTWSVVVQLPQKMLQSRIQELTCTYLTLSIKELASKLETPEAGIFSLVQSMIQAGELKGKINEKLKTLTFSEQPPDYEAMGKTIQEQSREMQNILQQAKLLNDDLAISKRYITQQMKFSEG